MASGWQQIAGALKFLRVDYSGRVWGINSANQIYTRLLGDVSWTQIDGLLVHLDIDGNGIVYGLNSNNDIFERQGVDEVPAGCGDQIRRVIF